MKHRPGPKPQDLTGQQFERLTVVGVASGTLESRYRLRWLCRCVCGGTRITRSDALKRGLTRSCGCLQREIAAQTLRDFYAKNPEGHPVVHGHTRGGSSPTYRSWMAMRQRCQNPHTQKYPRYGGRGIRVCGRWQLFVAFLEDMGERPVGHTLDRRDPNGDYCPQNCRWATPYAQWLNRRAIAGLPDADA